MITNREHLPTVSIFIDVPNVTKDRARISSANWTRLSEFIMRGELADLDTRNVDARAYLISHGDAETFAGKARSMFAASGFSVETKYAKDIDSLIINDMWAAVARHEKESISGGRIHFPLQLRFILVSGDGGYLRAIRSMNEVYGDNLELDLRVYSWKDRMNSELEQVASGVTYLEDIPSLVALALT